MGDQVLHLRARASRPGRDLFPWPSAAGRSRTRPIHRLVRLALAGGLAAAGLCLILGLTALAATLGRGSKAPGPGAMAAAVKPPGDNAGHGTPGPPPGRQATPPLGGRTIASLHGNGGQASAGFLVGRPGTWGIAWSFTCSPGHTGQLTVREKPGASAGDTRLSASGRRGAGTTWTVLDPGHHFLTITADCPWSLRLMLPAARSVEGRRRQPAAL